MKTQVLVLALPFLAMWSLVATASLSFNSTVITM